MLFAFARRLLAAAAVTASLLAAVPTPAQAAQPEVTMVLPDMTTPERTVLVPPQEDDSNLVLQPTVTFSEDYTATNIKARITVDNGLYLSRIRACCTPCDRIERGDMTCTDLGGWAFKAGKPETADFDFLYEVYRLGVYAGPTTKPGTATMTVTFWIDDITVTASGPVRVEAWPPPSTGAPTGTPSATPPSSSAAIPSASPSAQAAGEEDDDVRLPITGPATGGLIAGGVALLVGGFLLARRRRTRFEA
ncbi:LPXTG cell wall anchor domain-containing protein [Amorphoplanes digitatis]|uniref:Gram-positive cocci surface proteins LPxTG domain-containing protein n=1 Tax=Actinoplanes digitatis TaxID=1868 RepID=A0A7W7I421_9ACTN|nr:LPXTG cell wall anchor domain-containing protein [Actinoplanes digitatis]MBB4766046.1 hypothetical protein [Actinoplanes digitatis]GID97896.1 hypothetical protein Adi01nite_73080 [Actinoplanes digitatis]